MTDHREAASGPRSASSQPGAPSWAIDSGATSRSPGGPHGPEGPEPIDAGHESDDSGGRRRRSFFAELPVLVLVAFVLAFVLKTFLVQAFYIPSESMLPTLEVGDRVLVNKLVHEFREPRRGEVVVFSHEDAAVGPVPDDGMLVRLWETVAGGFGLAVAPEKDFIKRIIGLPGETIEMREGVVSVDGVAIPEAAAEEGGYLSRPDTVDFGPTEIPQGHYFVMGDNRPNSSDSRSLLDTIPEEELVGRAFVVIWPLDRLSTLSIGDYEAAP